MELLGVNTINIADVEGGEGGEGHRGIYPSSLSDKAKKPQKLGL